MNCIIRNAQMKDYHFFEKVNQKNHQSYMKNLVDLHEKVLSCQIDREMNVIKEKKKQRLTK